VPFSRSPRPSGRAAPDGAARRRTGGAGASSRRPRAPRERTWVSPNRLRQRAATAGLTFTRRSGSPLGYFARFERDQVPGTDREQRP